MSTICWKDNLKQVSYPAYVLVDSCLCLRIHPWCPKWGSCSMLPYILRYDPTCGRRRRSVYDHCYFMSRLTTTKMKRSKSHPTRKSMTYRCYYYSRDYYLEKFYLREILLGFHSTWGGLLLFRHKSGFYSWIASYCKEHRQYTLGESIIPASCIHDQPLDLNQGKLWGRSISLESSKDSA